MVRHHPGVAPAPLYLDALLLRSQLPELVLRQGMVLAARVMERHGRHGLINIAGAPLSAELPDELAPGDRMRLRVEDTTGERVVLRLVESPPAPPPGVAALPLPGGGQASVRVEDRDHDGAEGGDEGEATVALTYESPALGPVELRLALSAEAIGAGVRVAAGPPLALAEAGAAALGDALERATGRPARVQVSARRDPLDVYA